MAWLYRGSIAGGGLGSSNDESINHNCARDVYLLNRGRSVAAAAAGGQHYGSRGVTAVAAAARAEHECGQQCVSAERGGGAVSNSSCCIG